MAANITSVTIGFSHGIKREEYGPTKKADVSFTAAVDDKEDGTVVAAFLAHAAMAQVAEMLSAPTPNGAILEKTAAEPVAETAASGEAPPARRTRGPNKPKPETAAPVEEAKPTEEVSEPQSEPEQPATEDEWSASADDLVINDQELLSATSKRAGELGAREPIVKLISTFATRTEGPPFKVQEIPQAQRKDYLTKLAALTA